MDDYAFPGQNEAAPHWQRAVAEFGGSCHVCGTAIAVGDPIVNPAGEGWVHEECG